MAKASFDARLRDRKEAVGSDFDKVLDVLIADRKRAGCTDRPSHGIETTQGMKTGR